MRTHSNAWLWAALDLMLVVSVVLQSFVFVVLPLINDPSKALEQSTPPGNMIVNIAWPQGKLDVDLWVLAPGEGKAVGYSNKGGKVFNLLRDDLGVDGDDAPYNKEDAYSRGLPDGRYVVNVHGYSIDREVAVQVEIAIADGGSTRSLLKTTVTLKPKQERTVVQFRLKDGQIVAGSENIVFVPLRSAVK